MVENGVTRAVVCVCVEGIDNLPTDGAQTKSKRKAWRFYRGAMAGAQAGCILEGRLLLFTYNPEQERCIIQLRMAAAVGTTGVSKEVNSVVGGGGGCKCQWGMSQQCCRTSKGA